MDEKMLTEKAMLFGQRGWETRRAYLSQYHVGAWFVRRPGTNNWILLGQYPEVKDTDRKFIQP